MDCLFPQKMVDAVDGFFRQGAPQDGVQVACRIEIATEGFFDNHAPVFEAIGVLQGGTALSCLCGVCTVACQVATACSSLPDATCRARPDGSCEAAGGGNVCEVTCTSDEDCSVISAEHRCTANVCRLEPASPADPGEMLGGAGSPSETQCPASAVAANAVVLLGDTFFATSHEVTGFLEGEARDAGRLGPGERYRDHSRLTANALALSSLGLLDQYRTAVSDAEVKVVIMNGGGADVLLGSCETANADCPVISSAAEAFADLLNQMAEDGVQHVVFAGYPNPEPQAVRERMDALRPLLQEHCSDSPLPCSYLDLRDVFAGNYDDYILADGLNPTSAGAEATAAALWQLMQDNCIAQ